MNASIGPAYARCVDLRRGAVCVGCGRFPKLYPSVTPLLRVENRKGLSSAAIEDIELKLRNTAAKLVGAEMIFEVVQELDGYVMRFGFELRCARLILVFISILRDKCSKPTNMHEQMLLREQQAREREQVRVCFCFVFVVVSVACAEHFVTLRNESIANKTSVASDSNSKRKRCAIANDASNC